MVDNIPPEDIDLDIAVRVAMEQLESKEKPANGFGIWRIHKVK